MMLAATPAPNPLSMFTVNKPPEQLLSIERRADIPLNPVP